MKCPESGAYWPEKWRACRIKTVCVWWTNWGDMLEVKKYKMIFLLPSPSSPSNVLSFVLSFFFPSFLPSTSPSSCPPPTPPLHPPLLPADAGEAEGGQQAEYAPAAECWAQHSASESSGGRHCHHQNPGGGASAASAEGKPQKLVQISLLWGRWCSLWQSWWHICLQISIQFDWQNVQVIVKHWVITGFF